jgi:hypothetical protein
MIDDDPREVKKASSEFNLVNRIAEKITEFVDLSRKIEQHLRERVHERR